MSLNDQIIQPAQVIGQGTSGSGSGSSAFGDITGWPGTSTDLVRGDGSDAPLSAADILAAIAGIAINCGTSTGTANALAIASAVDTGTAFTAGRLYLAKANLANSGATTAALNGGTGGSILPIRKNPNNAALVGGEIAAGAWVLLYCDGTYLQLMAGRSLLPGDLGTGTPGANKFLDGLGAWRSLVPGDIPILSRTRANRISSNQTSFSGSYAANTVLFNNLSVNENTAWLLVSGILTLQSGWAGRWLIICNLAMTGNVEMLAALYKGSNVIDQNFMQSTGASANYQTLVAVEDFDAGDTLKAAVANNTGAGSLNYQASLDAAGGNSTCITMIFLGRK